MDLAVSEGRSLGPLTVKVSQTHCNHRRLLLFDINELDQTLLTASLKVPTIVTSYSDAQGCLVEHLLNVPLSNLELVILDDVERSLDTTRICAELNLSFGEVTHDRDFSLDTTIAT